MQARQASKMNQSTQQSQMSRMSEARDNRTDVQRKKDEERQRIRDQYDKDCARYEQEKANLKRALEVESLNGSGGLESPKTKKGRKSPKKDKTSKSLGTIKQRVGPAENEFSGISNLIGNFNQRHGPWALRPLTKAVGNIGRVKSQQGTGLKRTLQKVKLD